MEIQFKDKKTYTVNNPIEKKAFKGDKTGWLISFILDGNFNSDNVDKIFTKDNISEMTIYENEQTREIIGYDKVISLTIHHVDIFRAIVEVQLSKGL